MRGARLPLAGYERKRFPTIGVTGPKCTVGNPTYTCEAHPLRCGARASPWVATRPVVYAGFRDQIARQINHAEPANTAGPILVTGTAQTG
jgi:hypothetical protein